MTSRMPKTRPAAACPLCGDTPQCGMSQELDHCWCFECTFPGELLNLVPDAQIGVACICRLCVEAAYNILAEAEELTLHTLLTRRRVSLM